MTDSKRTHWRPADVTRPEPARATTSTAYLRERLREILTSPELVAKALPLLDARIAANPKRRDLADIRARLMQEVARRARRDGVKA